MPLIASSYTKRPFLFSNSYLETLYPYFTTKVRQVAYDRERLELDDGDFLDLDWIRRDSNQLIIMSHGFEGNSNDHFIEKSAAFLSKNNFDIMVWHYRSCGGELNRLPRFYHHGDIQDLGAVVKYASSTYSYQSVHLVGFSMGGNLVINYLGSHLKHTSIKGGVVFSTPMDLAKATKILSKGLNKHLEKTFFRKLKNKVIQKQLRFPDYIDSQKLIQTKGLAEIFQKILLPLNGFLSPEEYHEQWSSKQFLENIDIPLLIVNAINDPLLTPGCYPIDICEKSRRVFLETPKYGGHMGFTRHTKGNLWYPQRILSFFQELKA